MYKEGPLYQVQEIYSIPPRADLVPLSNSYSIACGNAGLTRDIIIVILV